MEIGLDVLVKSNGISKVFNQIDLDQNKQVEQSELVHFLTENFVGEK